MRENGRDTTIMVDMPNDDKSAFRRMARKRPPATEAESAAAAGHLGDLLHTTPPASVLLYRSMPGEVSVDRVAEASDRGHTYLVTRTPDDGGPLTIHLWNSARERHRFGYRQPPAGTPEVPAESVDIVVVPGLCFDSRGGRLGWGKGYYDQLLPKLTNATVIMGVTLTRLIVDRVPTDPHDAMMTHLLTEAGVVSVAQ
jgi:5-formyltetrahydrofolate cyclo-ligase